MGEAGTAVSRRENVKLTEPSLSKGSKPEGEYERVPADNKGGRGVVLQNESADLLAAKGFFLVSCTTVAAALNEGDE